MTASRCLIPCWRIQAPLRSPKAWLPSPAVLLSPAVLSLLIVTLPTCLWHSSVSSTFADEGTHKEDGTAKEIVLVAGSRSHGFGSHEHYAGLRILQDALQKSDDNLKVSLSKGWPKPKMLERADTVVIYCDGGKRHVAMDHRAELKSLLAEGCGLVCLHYAVEMVPGQSGDDWVEMLGGHFEVNYSVNPHWDADFTLLPTHPITYGVEPFQANDEWYFHMRFSDAGKLTPILSAVAPESTMRRKDGPHSGNPHVRKSVAAGEPQTVAWAYERPGGGRSFGFTGGHFHWNWGNDNIRRLVTNAIRWTAGADIEMDGSDLGDKIGIESLLQNQDYDPPKNFDEREIAERFELLSQPRRSSRESARAVKLVATPVEQPSTAESDPRDPKNAVAGIEVADGLELTLSASEPLLKSLTNLDIDSRGRVWVCDVMNYRRNQGSRPEGDRILILEDTDGDGVTDTSKTFYQGRDIDSAMGLCVLDHEAGCDVIVTASPNVWKFSDHDGDGVPESKVALFTGVGDPQHDHSGHSFLFGPDGKLYWNFGNTGKRVNDADGNPVVDIHGRIVVDNGKPFYGGMPFRCDLDGSNFEVLAHNFRNNWETTVDSFGTLWQSDNDDDGNKGTRINFVMEHGNYGYLDEMTGKGWREDRINLEPEIMHRHWHLHDPGVVPNLLQTGAGSPSGICFYEGRLLPERFWDQMIHCDPGPNMVRAYPTRSAGAGYTAVIEPLLTGIEDRWFRPADVCVAPDGSLFVSDWYDPGVGGHRQGDSDRGRLFRIAPPGVGYTLPDYDYSSAEGATEALRNPNVAIRARAWRSLNAMGADAKPALEKMADDPNPRMAARALWLLGKIEGESNPTVERAMRHPDPDVRIMAIRLAKQHTKQPSQWLTDAVDDESPAVRRELAVALRFDESETMPVVWAQLAAKHDGQDRWYLEALGIGSDLRAAECLDAYMKLVDGQWDTPGGRDIVWRVRAPKAADAIVSLLADPKLSAKATERYFRSLEFHSAEVRNVALMKLIPSDSGGDPRSDIVAIRAAERMSDPSLLQRPEVMAAVDRQLDRAQGTPDFIRIIKRFQPKGIEKRLLTVLDGEDASAGVEAAESLLELEAGRAALRKRLQSGDVRATEYVGFVGNARANHFLAELIVDAERSYDQRRVAIEALAKTRDGANRLLAAAEQKKLLGDSVLVAGAMLSRNSSQGIRIRAGQLLPTPSQKDDKPLPPIDQLAKMNGDLERGRKLFEGTATCSKCHVVGGKGKEVGPNLSEIGNKLSREAMLTAILAPSAGISHNYEGYTVLTDEGQVIAGLKLSESDKEIVIRTADAIDRKIPSEEIETLKKNEKSLMPENLHHLIGQQGLIDLVEYMTSLKKKEQRTRQQTTQ